jgi:predicted GNAT family acetyltransferase
VLGYPLEMEIKIDFSDDPAFVLRRAGESLSSQPVLHNLILTLLHARASQPEPGRYWVAMEREEAAGVVDKWLATGRIWVWDDGEPVSMAVSSPPVEGVVRVAGVYTPADKRRHGFAAACVQALSKCIRDAGFRCVLYTDLGNPTSNSVYRRIGYRAVAEVLRYRFE